MVYLGPSPANESKGLIKRFRPYSRQFYGYSVDPHFIGGDTGNIDISYQLTIALYYCTD